MLIKNIPIKVKKDLLTSNFEKVAESKKLCVECCQPIGESNIKGTKRTKKQTYNYLKSKSLDGKVRCQECTIRWLQKKIEEISDEYPDTIK